MNQNNVMSLTQAEVGPSHVPACLTLVGIYKKKNPGGIFPPAKRASDKASIREEKDRPPKPGLFPSDP